MPYKDPQVQKQKNKEYNKKWRAEKPNAHRAASSKWTKSNPEKDRAKNNRYRNKHPERMLFSYARRRAMRAGMDFTIEVRDVIIPNTCPILGQPLLKGTPYAPSLDRIDTTKGYVKGNVWVISWRANRIKSDATLAELELLVRALHQATDPLPSKEGSDADV